MKMPYPYKTILEVEQLTVGIEIDGHLGYAARNVSFAVNHAEFLGIVGESGSGKTVTTMALMGLETVYPGSIAGRVKFYVDHQPVDVLATITEYVNSKNGYPMKQKLAWQKWVQRTVQPLLQGEVAYLLQDGHKTLNPYLRIESQFLEILWRKKHGWKKSFWPGGFAIRWLRQQEYAALRKEAKKYLKLVQFRHVESILNAYPHELSGGMAQRVSIALALAGDPKFLILDEPTSGLDVTLQAALLNLLLSLKHRLQLSGIIISHELNFVSRISERIAVMYSGQVWEMGPTSQVMNRNYPMKHPYTRFLLERNHRFLARSWKFSNNIWHRSRLGCPIRESCPAYQEKKHNMNWKQCATKEPPIVLISPEHWIRCWLFKTEGTS